MLQARHVDSGLAGKAHVAFTDRWGGYSFGSFNSLNLGRSVGDDDTLVDANRSALAAVLSLSADKISFVSQVHGADVHHVQTDDDIGLGPQADAQITARPGVGLAILTADCVPVALTAPDTGHVGVVHAGRRGMLAGAAVQAAEEMRAAGAKRISAYIGPSICPRCYEVPESMREEAMEICPVSGAVSAVGTAAVDVAGGVAHQLAEAGVEIAEFSRTCTYESADLFSYRREQITGRTAVVAWFEPSGDTP